MYQHESFENKTTKPNKTQTPKKLKKPKANSNHLLREVCDPGQGLVEGGRVRQV
jgi:hypothetical protein